MIMASLADRNGVIARNNYLQLVVMVRLNVTRQIIIDIDHCIEVSDGTSRGCDVVWGSFRV